MNLNDTILSRRTVHSYTEDLLPTEIFNQTINIAIHALNHKLTMPWLFLNAGPRSRSMLANLAIELKIKKDGKLPAATEQALKKKYSQEGSLIVLAQRRSKDPREEQEDYAAIACAVQNMSLFLWSQGYGSKWSTGQILDNEKTYQIFGINKIEHAIVGFFWCGQPRGPIRQVIRPSAQEFIRFID